MVLTAAAAVGDDEKASYCDVVFPVLATLRSWPLSRCRESSVSRVAFEGAGFWLGRSRDSSAVSSTLESAVEARRGLEGGLGCGLFEGESNRKVSSMPLLEAGMGERGAEKLDSMSWRCWRTAISA